MRLHDLLAEYLERSPMNGPAVSRALGVHRSTVHSWMRGKKMPHGRNLTALLDVLCVEGDARLQAYRLAVEREA